MKGGKRLRVRATSAAARICKLSTSLSGRIYIYVMHFNFVVVGSMHNE